MKTTKDANGAEIAYANPLVAAGYPAGTIPSKGATGAKRPHRHHRNHRRHEYHNDVF